jgi:glycosyltransferase involved in cell wall biosynthesis
MEPKIPATVGILTFNSAATLERALESVKAFDEILLCDGGSTDGTLDLAKRFGVRVILQNPNDVTPGPIKDFSVVRNRCLDAAQYDWFLYIDSDEKVEPGLVEEIRVLVARNEPGPRVYRVSPRIMLGDRRIEHTTSYPGFQYRFCKRGPGLRFVKAIHERLEPPAGSFIGQVSGHWNYFITGPESISEDIFTRDIPRLLKRYDYVSRMKCYRGAMIAWRAMLVIPFKYAWLCLRYRHGVMPWTVERARMWVQWQYGLALWRKGNTL